MRPPPFHPTPPPPGHRLSRRPRRTSASISPPCLRGSRLKCSLRSESNRRIASTQRENSSSRWALPPAHNIVPHPPTLSPRALTLSRFRHDRTAIPLCPQSDEARTQHQNLQNAIDKVNQMLTTAAESLVEVEPSEETKARIRSLGEKYSMKYHKKINIIHYTYTYIYVSFIVQHPRVNSYRRVGVSAGWF